MATLNEAQQTRIIAESQLKYIEDMERKKQLSLVLDRLEAANYQADHETASDQQGERQTGEWLLQHSSFTDWKSTDACKHPTLYLNGMPGAGNDTDLPTCMLINDC